MAPEQLQGDVTRRTDIFAAAIVLWEALVGKRLFAGDNEGAILLKLLNDPIEPPSAHEPGLPSAVDAVVLRALDRDPAQRFATAREMAVALERALPPASATEIGEWVELTAHGTLTTRAERVAEIESSTSDVSGAGHDLVATTVGVPPPTSSVSGPHPLAEPPVSQPSQLSSISSLSREHAGLPQRRRVPVWAFGVAGAAVLLLGIAGVIGAVGMRSGGNEAKHEPAKSIDPLPVPPPIREPTAPATAPSAQPTASPPPAAPSASAKPVSPPVTHATVRPPSTAAKPPPPPPPPTATATAKKSCDPPFTLDAQGHKKWKPECL
jgi:serine/threonine-protein kinase